MSQEEPINKNIDTFALFEMVNTNRVNDLNKRLQGEIRLSCRLRKIENKLRVMERDISELKFNQLNNQLNNQLKGK